MRILLLHAFPLGPEMWEAQAAALGEDVVVPALYGRGTSLDEWARQLLEEVEGEIVPVGASMGGYCALALARLAPERLRGLALIGSRSAADDDERKAGRTALAERARREGAEAVWQGMLPVLFPPGADPALVERAHAMALAQDPDELADALLAMRDRPDGGDVIRGLEVPLLVVAGEHDPFGPEAPSIAGEAPRGEYRKIRAAGHLPALQTPDELTAVLRDWLADL